MALAMNQYQRKRNAMTLTKALGILGYESWSALDKGELKYVNCKWPFHGR